VSRDGAIDPVVQISETNHRISQMIDFQVPTFTIAGSTCIALWNTGVSLKYDSYFTRIKSVCRKISEH
jgi:hypothetical protein